jgi:hypothetical protein
MPKFVRIVSFSGGGKFNNAKDSKHLNDVLEKLQSHGAAIQKISMELSAAGNGAVLAFLIEYEADSPVEI